MESASARSASSLPSSRLPLRIRLVDARDRTRRRKLRLNARQRRMKAIEENPLVAVQRIEPLVSGADW